MTFLNPAVLFGLFAAVIPILLHIFNLRKLKKIEFSTLTFLKELQKTKIRKLKIRQLILLILRTLLIILIVFAFSRPTLKGTLPGQIAEQAKTTAVILIDDSPSMTASDEQGELLHQAKEVANNILNLLKDGDEVIFVKLSEAQQEISETKHVPQKNFTFIRNIINNANSSFIHRKLEDALNYCAKLLYTSKNYNKEIYIISDFRIGSFQSKFATANKMENVFPPGTQVFLVNLGRKEINNIGIESVEMQNAILEVNKPFSIKVRITNYSNAYINNYIVKVYLDGQCVAQKGVDIKSNQPVEVEFSLIPRTSGFIEGKVELEEDKLDYDNKRFFTVFIPDELKVLIAGEEKDYKYIKIALKAASADSSTALKITETSNIKFSALQLDNTNAVIITDIAKMSVNQCQMLKSYLQRGGGILIFPNTQSTLSDFNNNLKIILGYSLNAYLGNVIDTQESFLEFSKIDFKHPLFAGMFEEEQAGKKQQRILESPQINKYLRFSPTPNSRVIISLSNGEDPFITEEKIDNGKMMLLSVSATREWSDFPFKSLFAPFIHRSIIYLAQQPLSESSINIGNKKIVQVTGFGSSKLILRKPNGTENTISQGQIIQGGKLLLSDMDIPGCYSLSANKKVINKFAVNIDSDESNVISVDDKMILKMLEKTNLPGNAVHILENLEEIQRTITEVRLGTELWKHLLILSIIIALIEMFIARDTKKSIASMNAKLR